MPVKQRYRYEIVGHNKVVTATDPTRAAEQFCSFLAHQEHGDRGTYHDLSWCREVGPAAILYTAFIGEDIGRGQTHGRNREFVVACTRQPVKD